VLSQLRMDEQTLAGRLRLTLTSSSEEKVDAGFSTVCPLSVALRPQSHPDRPANSSFRPSSYSAAMAGQASELGRCLVVQITGMSVRAGVQCDWMLSRVAVVFLLGRGQVLCRRVRSAWW